MAASPLLVAAIVDDSSSELEVVCAPYSQLAQTWRRLPGRLRGWTKGCQTAR
jgi:hypothetical protein